MITRADSFLTCQLKHRANNMQTHADPFIPPAIISLPALVTSTHKSVAFDCDDCTSNNSAIRSKQDCAKLDSEATIAFQHSKTELVYHTRTVLASMIPLPTEEFIVDTNCSVQDVDKTQPVSKEYQIVPEPVIRSDSSSSILAQPEESHAYQPVSPIHLHKLMDPDHELDEDQSKAMADVTNFMQRKFDQQQPMFSTGSFIDIRALYQPGICVSPDHLDDERGAADHVYYTDLLDSNGKCMVKITITGADERVSFVSLGSSGHGWMKGVNRLKCGAKKTGKAIRRGVRFLWRYSFGSAIKSRANFD